MKSPDDMANILYQQLQGTTLKAAITGDVYKGDRPDNSTKEDVVINPLSLTGNEFQYGTANANLYVPDIGVKLKGKDQTVANYARLKLLTDLALPILKDRYTDSYKFELVTIGNPVALPDIKYHYVNLRIDFMFFPS
ncbi:hypothetical protein [Spirosoma validum]|uniref:Uncharacterized protein n=1 Tax=Spirosoma validum TaxID=2771355 RepID=A0A927B1E1_9BACT|nr:hypothetical protein [Spirosoma validum]MBD2753786.1 hypothetical protein [Spirosoma validum]